MLWVKKKPGNDLLSHREAAVREYPLGEYAVPSAKQGVDFRVGRAPPYGVSPGGRGQRVYGGRRFLGGRVACCGGSAFVNTRSLIGRASGSDRFAPFRPGSSRGGDGIRN
jgi:hypothetical protein